MLAGVNKKLKVGEALITQQQLPLRFFYVPRVVVLIPLIVFSLMIVHTLFSLLFPSLYLNKFLVNQLCWLLAQLLLKT